MDKFVPGNVFLVLTMISILSPLPLIMATEPTPPTEGCNPISGTIYNGQTHSWSHAVYWHGDMYITITYSLLPGTSDSQVRVEVQFLGVMKYGIGQGGSAYAQYLDLPQSGTGYYRVKSTGGTGFTYSGEYCWTNF